MSEKLYRLVTQNNQIDLHLSGRWTLSNLGDIEAKLVLEFEQGLDQLRLGKTTLGGASQKIVYSMYAEKIEAVDTSAVLIFKKLENLVRTFNTDSEIHYVDLPNEFASLKDKLAEYDLNQPHEVAHKFVSPSDILAAFGLASLNLFKAFWEIPQLFGLFVYGLFEILRRPFEFKFTSMVFHLQQMTIPAIAIVASVSFMVGAVLTEQAVVRLPGFGTETFVVGFIGMVTARETSILLTGMLVAGRTSSAITAEIGSMRMNEEIDAMKVMGLDVMKFLVMPRAIAMLLTLPILTFISIVSGFAGSGVLLYMRYEMSFNEFVSLIYNGVEISDIGTAMVKTPFIAISMVLVACSEGLKVRSNAASLGYHTTVSVVKSLFLVIIIDSIIAIYFTQISTFGGW
ncbi:MAG: ABC transporter permease [Alphaproteobacteria bacterium]|nr:ABC transporter permease [Alphaproteobacteria bacterium]